MIFALAREMSQVIDKRFTLRGAIILFLPLLFIADPFLFMCRLSLLFLNNFFAFCAISVPSSPPANVGGKVALLRLITYWSIILSSNFCPPQQALIGKMVHRGREEASVKVAINMVLVQKLRSFGEGIIVCTTPRQFLIDTYPVTVLAEMAKMSPTPMEVSDTFSMMSVRNGSDRGIWTVFTGKSNPSMTGVIKAWNNQTEVKCWQGEPCDQIRGSEGAFFAPPINEEKKISIFSPELNVSMIGTYSHSFHEHSLLKYRFSLFENQFKNRENSCYCSKEDEQRKKYCSFDGLIDLYNCSGGLPFLMSKPHFYNSEKILLNWTYGLTPDRKLHESYMDLDPFLGVVSGATVRMQLNIDMAPIRQVGYVNSWFIISKWPCYLNLSPQIALFLFFLLPSLPSSVNLLCFFLQFKLFDRKYSSLTARINWLILECFFGRPRWPSLAKGKNNSAPGAKRPQKNFQIFKGESLKI